MKVISKQKNHNKPLRLLDFGSTWKEHGLGSRYRIIRWYGPNHFEWEGLGWKLGNTFYADRRSASRARDGLEKISDVMES